MILQCHTRLTHQDSLRDKLNAEITVVITRQHLPPSGTALTDDGTDDVEFTSITSGSDPNDVNIANINFSCTEKQLLLETLDENSSYYLSVAPHVHRFHHQGKVTLSEVLSVKVCNHWVEVLQQLIAKLPSFCLGNHSVIILTNYKKEVGDQEYC